MESGAVSFIRLLRNSFKFRLYLFSSIPSAFFSGLRIREIEEDRAVVTVPYTWFSKNPFHSTYFACLSMAAEMSTGVLAMAQIYKRQPAISMLVVRTEANYFKKATGLTRFCCTDGLLIKAAIEQAISTGDGQTVQVRSLGTNKNGEEVAEFLITWSFKVKNKLVV